MDKPGGNYKNVESKMNAETKTQSKHLQLTCLRHDNHLKSNYNLKRGNVKSMALGPSNYNGSIRSETLK